MDKIEKAINELSLYMISDAYCEAPSNDTCVTAIAVLRAQLTAQSNDPLTLDGVCEFCPLCNNGCISDDNHTDCLMLPVVAMAKAYTVGRIKEIACCSQSGDDNAPLTLKELK